MFPRLATFRRHLLLLAMLAAPLGAVAQQFVWPTPLPVDSGMPWQHIVQAAASGDPATGLFGTARNNGSKFHEGLDIRPYARDRRGEPTDSVRAVMAGTVVHLVPAPNGPYGRYVVLQHTEAGLHFYTLYAHLQSVSSDLKVGQPVTAGRTLGILGRSDGNRGFAKDRAHLHFEVGVRLGDTFNNWYARQKGFTSPNRQGLWNGINLNATDPLPFLRAGIASGKPPSYAALLKQEPTALTVLVSTNRIPTLVRESPALLTAPLPAQIAGWKIEFAWHGLPVRWTPLTLTPNKVAGLKGLTMTPAPDQELLRKARVRGIVAQQRNGTYTAGTALHTILEIIFDW